MINIFGKKPATPKPARKPGGFFTTDVYNRSGPERIDQLHASMKRSFQVPMPTAKGHTMDSAIVFDAANGDPSRSAKSALNHFRNTLPDAQIEWYAGQGFIGYQISAMIAQHWLVNKACTMPARDAVRVGYEINVTDGKNVPAETFDLIKKLDKKFKVRENLVEYVRMSRVFGLRVTLFRVESKDPLYYEKPFNPDGITPGSYKGISQIDPMWCVPELTAESTSDPASIDFYVPTYWNIGGKRYHKSHLIISIPDPVADNLKPSYNFGGLSIPQKIYERVYGAERTTNEAPMLAMTKRLTVLSLDVEKAMLRGKSFVEKIMNWAYFRDNYGVKIVGGDETIQQFDTSLADLDAVIMTQYQIVCGVAGVPATKLLGTSPKGFNASGEFEIDSYNQELETIQANDMTPLLNRHHMMLIRSEVSPKAPFETEVVWNPLKKPSAQERATINSTNATTGQTLINSGAINAYEERERLRRDPESGYANLPEMDEDDLIDENLEDEELNGDEPKDDEEAAA